MRFERRHSFRLFQLHFHVTIFSILGLILRVIADHVLISQFDRNSGSDAR